MNTTRLKDFFGQLFTELNSQDSIIVLFILGFTVLLSMLIGWLLRGGKVKRLKNQLKAEEQKYQLLHAENAGLEEQFKQQSTEIQNKVAQIDKLEADVQSYEQNQFKLRNSLKTAQNEVENLNKQQVLSQQSSTDFEDKLAAYEDQATAYENQLHERAQETAKVQEELEKLKAENEQVEAELEKILDGKSPSVVPSSTSIQTAFAKINGLEYRLRQMENENRILQSSVLEVKTESGEKVAQGDISTLRSQLNILVEENKDLKRRVSDLKNSEPSKVIRVSSKELQEAEARVAALEAENARLKTQQPTNGFHTGGVIIPPAITDDPELDDLILETDKPDAVDLQQVELLKTQKSQFTVMGDRIDVAEVVPAEQYTNDDLTKIEGVGPFIAKKLNEVGITSFKQISLMDDLEIDRVTKAIQFFPGRIERDDWVGQAKKLMG